ncbi:MAG: alpha-amylase family glycosyl hydrolase [bacterium]
MKIYIKLFVILFLPIIIPAQVLTWSPPFPVDDGPIEIRYDAAQGNGELDGVEFVYFHTGVITDKSTSASDWKYVKGEWGTPSSAYSMENISPDVWRLYVYNVRAFYGVPANEQILQIAIVFRNGTGTLQDPRGEDFFIPISEAGLDVRIVQPGDDQVFVKEGDQVDVLAISKDAINLKLFVNGTNVAETINDSLEYTLDVTDAGKKTVVAVAESELLAVSDTVTLIVRGNPTIEELPAGIIDGINYVNNNSVTLSLYAPNKEFVYVIGDFNGWGYEQDYLMKMTPDSARFWLQIDGLTPGQEYAFQYLVDGTIRIADPYTEKILDPWNDQYISASTYPNLKAYPAGQTSDAVSILQTVQQPYQWQIENFIRPKNTDLVIYELLLRDFLTAHDFETLTDTLNYLDSLGVTAIELMPISEFEGNNSWGYNPSFYFAVDKYYGPAGDLKIFIDECHKRGIAVILDIVLNHSYGQSPLVRLYSSGNYGPPTAENPWYNVTSPNPVYSWGNDFNHTSPQTKAFVKRVFEYWVTQFKFDGFRLDFTKGFTNTPGDGWAHDNARIAILEEYADYLWSIDSTLYMILEHFTANTEEKILAEYGMMIWGNITGEYGNASISATSNLIGASYTSGAWNKPHKVAYMESHDEERLMYKNLTQGNFSGDYNIRQLNIALQRVKLCAAFFLTIPGPKMLWQFGELGYDFSINYPSGTSDDRTTPKPIRWDYLNNINRKNLYGVIRELNNLRTKYDIFETEDFTFDLSKFAKRINLDSDTMNVTIVGNFGVYERTLDNPNFQYAGTWYDYFSNDSINVINPNEAITLQAGEFHIYTDVKLPAPDPYLLVGINGDHFDPEIPAGYKLEQNYPNPFNPSTVISYQLPVISKIELKIYDVLGREIKTLVDTEQLPGYYSIEWNGKDNSGNQAASGIYFYRLTSGGFSITQKLMLMR